ncbi:MAG TPA: SIS domain-containing protein [Armatimonadota bacterium]|jgi:D-sedoheptulose 7-phosphate isomerase
MDLLESLSAKTADGIALKPSTLKHLEEFVRRYPALAGNKDSVRRAAEFICKSYRAGGKILVCGNGGSAADSEHIVGELMKEFILPRHLPESDLRKLQEIGCSRLAGCLQQGIPAIALTAHTSIATAILNDTDPQVCFAQQVYVYGRPNDVLLVLSTSGNSANVLNAVKVARAFGLTTLGLTGSKPSAIDEHCDVTIKVPADKTFMVQELHLPVYHTICLMAEEELFG